MNPLLLEKMKKSEGTSSKSICIPSTSISTSTSSTTSNTDEILLDLDKVKQIQYWKKRAMKAIHDNHLLTEKNMTLREKNCSLGEENHSLIQDVDNVTRRAKDFELENVQLKGTVEYLKSKRRRSLVASNYTVTEHEIEAVAKGKDMQELIVAARERQVKQIVGSSLRSKWANYNFSDQSRDDNVSE